MIEFDKYKLDIKEVSTKRRKANITDEIAKKLRKDSEIDSVIKVIEPKGSIDRNVFPQVSSLDWNTVKLVLVKTFFI